MNWIGVKAIYIHEMDRMRRTTIQSIFAPVISASLYFVVFGSAIGSRIPMIQDVSYGSFIVPGMMMLALLTQSVSNASSGIFFPKFLGTINEIYAAPLSTTEIIIGFVGARAFGGGNVCSSAKETSTKLDIFLNSFKLSAR